MGKKLESMLVGPLANLRSVFDHLEGLVQARKRYVGPSAPELDDLKQIFKKNIEIVLEMARSSDKMEPSRTSSKDSSHRPSLHCSADEGIKEIEELNGNLLENISKFAEISHTCERNFARWKEENQVELHYRKSLSREIDCFLEDLQSKLLSKTTIASSLEEISQGLCSLSITEDEDLNYHEEAFAYLVAEIKSFLRSAKNISQEIELKVSKLMVARKTSEQFKSHYSSRNTSPNKSSKLASLRSDLPQSVNWRDRSPMPSTSGSKSTTWFELNAIVSQSEKRIEEKMQDVSLRLAREERRVSGLSESLALVNRMQRDSIKNNRQEIELESNSRKMKEITEEIIATKRRENEALLKLRYAESQLTSDLASKANYETEIASLIKTRDKFKQELRETQEKMFEIQSRNELFELEKSVLKSQLDELMREKTLMGLKLEQNNTEKSEFEISLKLAADKCKELETKLAESEKNLKSLSAAKQVIEAITLKEKDHAKNATPLSKSTSPRPTINLIPAEEIHQKRQSTNSLTSAASKVIEMQRMIDKQHREVAEYKRCIDNRNIEIDILKRQSKLIEQELEKCKRTLAENPLAKKVIALETEIIIAKSNLLEKKQSNTLEKSCSTGLTEAHIHEIESLKEQLLEQIEHCEILKNKHSEVSKSYKLLQQQFEAEAQERKSYKTSFVELETQVIILRSRISDLEEALVRTCFRLQEPATLDSEENSRLILAELEDLKMQTQHINLADLSEILRGQTEERRVRPQQLFSMLSELLPKLPVRLFPNFHLAFSGFILN